MRGVACWWLAIEWVRSLQSVRRRLIVRRRIRRWSGKLDARVPDVLSAIVSDLVDALDVRRTNDYMTLQLSTGIRYNRRKSL